MKLRLWEHVERVQNSARHFVIFGKAMCGETPEVWTTNENLFFAYTPRKSDPKCAACTTAFNAFYGVHRGGRYKELHPKGVRYSDFGSPRLIKDVAKDDLDIRKAKAMEMLKQQYIRERVAHSSNFLSTVELAHGFDKEVFLPKGEFHPVVKPSLVTVVAQREAYQLGGSFVHFELGEKYTMCGEHQSALRSQDFLTHHYSYFFGLPMQNDPSRCLSCSEVFNTMFGLEYAPDYGSQIVPKAVGGKESFLHQMLEADIPKMRAAQWARHMSNPHIDELVVLRTWGQ